MAVYTLLANDTSQQTPKLAKGTVRLYSTVPIYWVVGEDPQVTPGRSAVLSVGTTQELRLPVKCSRIAIQAVNESGSVTIIEVLGGASASCS